MIIFQQNASTASEIEAHLNDCEGPFLDALRARVDLGAYVAKLVSLSERFEALEDGRLVGFVAAYCNDEKRENAFVSNVNVLTPWRGRGIATSLMKAAITRATDLEFCGMQLEVMNDNTDAIKLYERLGFVDVDGDVIRKKMRLEFVR